MLKFVKFLKDLLTNKRKMEESVAVVLEGNCSALLQKNLPNKMKDPGSFINVMPYTFFRKLGLRE